ncbi:MAG: methyltransferase domain-containing protein [candidate division KSB1 bacterium]|nr:methyltransferase domain-containing protein [candidate division KSB1 bacterium]
MAGLDPRQAFFDALAPDWQDTAQRCDNLQAILGVLHLTPGMRVLDLGCGTGWLARAIKRLTNGETSVIAADLSRDMLKEGRRRSCSDAIPLCQADAHALPFAPATLDVVVVHAAFAHFRHKEEALRAIADALRPGGRLVIAHPASRSELRLLHRRVGPPVSQDILPPQAVLVRWLRNCHLSMLGYVDRPGLYLVVAAKQAPGSQHLQV